MADLILKVTSEEVRNKAQEISTQRELLEGYMQEMQNQVTSLESSWEADSGSKYMEVYQNVSNNIKGKWHRQRILQYLLFPQTQ